MELDEKLENMTDEQLEKLGLSFYRVTVRKTEVREYDFVVLAESEDMAKDQAEQLESENAACSDEWIEEEWTGREAEAITMDEAENLIDLEDTILTDEAARLLEVEE